MTEITEIQTYLELGKALMNPNRWMEAGCTGVFQKKNMMLQNAANC